MLCFSSEVVAILSVPSVLLTFSEFLLFFKMATGTDRAAGYGMMLVSAVIFVYYTIWVVLLVSLHGKYFSLLSRYLNWHIRNAWLLDSSAKETFPATLKGSILLDSIPRLTEKATENVVFFVDLSRFFLCDFCCHGLGQPGVR